MTSTTNIMCTMAILVLVMWTMMSGAAQAQDIVYYHTDALGTPVAMTNSSGSVIERREYEPYGRQLNPAMVTDGPGFTGHVSDAATGLAYMQQRYYDPQLGRFLSVDPVGASPVNGLNFNHYAYANNNPIVNTDPDGRNPSNYLDDIKQALFSYVVKTVETVGKGLVSDISNVATNDLATHTYTGSAGLSGTIATPLGVPFVSPSVGLTASGTFSLNSHGQFAVNGAIGPVVGTGGGASGGVAFGASRTEGSALPTGLSTSITNHVEGDFSVPGVPVSFGVGADWNKDGMSASSGLARLSYGPIIFAGGGMQSNFTYTFNDGDGKK